MGCVSAVCWRSLSMASQLQVTSRMPTVAWSNNHAPRNHKDNGGLYTGEHAHNVDLWYLTWSPPTGRLVWAFLFVFCVLVWTEIFFIRSSVDKLHLVTSEHYFIDISAQLYPIYFHSARNNVQFLLSTKGSAPFGLANGQVAVIPLVYVVTVNGTFH